MRILVIGAGAVSGYFGARLVQHGRDVTFLVRAGRAAQLRSHGLRVAGELGEFSVQPKLLTAAELRDTEPAFDLVLLGVKAYTLGEAMEDFAPAVGPQTVLLPLLNGMGHLDGLAARFGKGAVLGGLTRIVAELAEDGHVEVFETLHDLTFGELDRQVTGRIRDIADTLSGCGFEAVLAPDIVGAMWFKWVMLASIGSITLLGRGSIGEVNRAPGGRELAQGIIAEALSIAEASGSPLSPADVEAITRRLTLLESNLVPSMYRDLYKGLPVEADQILGDLLRRGAAHGLSTPLLRAAYTQTKVYEARRG